MKSSKEEIAGLILELCEKLASKTRVVYLCNLNFKTVKPHLERLTVRACCKYRRNPLPLIRPQLKALKLWSTSKLQGA